MSIFTKISKSSIKDNEEQGIPQVELLSATDGVHGTDGEGNSTDTRRKKEKTDGEHGTDGEDFGRDESVKKDNKKRRIDLLNMNSQGEVQKWTEIESQHKNGVADKESEFLMDSVPGDDDEYLTDGVRSMYGESEAGIFKRMLFKSKPDRSTAKPMRAIHAFFARFTQKRVSYESSPNAESLHTDTGITNFAKHNDAAINEALERWKEAERYFDMLPHNDLVDYAVYNLEAARRRYIFLLNLEKKQSEIAKELGLSEEFESERAKKPMREHMMRIPNDVLPQ